MKVKNSNYLNYWNTLLTSKYYCKFYHLFSKNGNQTKMSKLFFKSLPIIKSNTSCSPLFVLQSALYNFRHLIRFDIQRFGKKKYHQAVFLNLDNKSRYALKFLYNQIFKSKVAQGSSKINMHLAICYFILGLFYKVNTFSKKYLQYYHAHYKDLKTNNKYFFLKFSKKSSASFRKKFSIKDKKLKLLKSFLKFRFSKSKNFIKIVKKPKIGFKISKQKFGNKLFKRKRFKRKIKTIVKKNYLFLKKRALHLNDVKRRRKAYKKVWFDTAIKKIQAVWKLRFRGTNLPTNYVKWCRRYLTISKPVSIHKLPNLNNSLINYSNVRSRFYSNFIGEQTSQKSMHLLFLKNLSIHSTTFFLLFISVLKIMKNKILQNKYFLNTAMITNFIEEYTSRVSKNSQKKTIHSQRSKSFVNNFLLNKRKTSNYLKNSTTKQITGFLQPNTIFIRKYYKQPMISTLAIA